MIGNDIVDLKVAFNESNWRRKGFLDKIFGECEIQWIKNAIDPDILVWNLWSRKEAVYKIFNRETGIRIFNPKAFICLDWDSELGQVCILDKIYFTKTKTRKHFIYTVAVTKVEDFEKIKILGTKNKLLKINGIPNYFNPKTQALDLASKTHHGRFEKIISINSQS